MSAIVDLSIKHPECNESHNYTLRACYLNRSYEHNGHYFILARVKVRNAVKFCNWMEIDNFKEQKFKKPGVCKGFRLLRRAKFCD